MPDKVVCIVGPTGCGKTALGVLLAQSLGGEIVSCDSMQIYRGMTIGTAAPTEEEMGGVPHHMIGVVDPRESYSAARYVRDADVCVQDILSRGRVPILVGGTGLYLDALLRGAEFAAGDASGEWRAVLTRRARTEGLDALYEELRRVDASRAQALDPHDEKRVIRALEIFYTTGKTMTEHDRATRDLPLRYEPVYLGLAYAEREQMKRVIDLRVDRMVDAGLFDEVRALLDAGLPADATALQAIGYKQSLAYFAGAATREETIAEIKLRSRQYAKRQLTWLRRNDAIHWFLWNESRDFAAALRFSTQILTMYGVS